VSAWRIEWLEPGRRSLLDLPWRDAARVDEAVQRFAATGEGDVVRLRTDDAVTLRLRVPPYTVRMSLDRWEATIRVWVVYRLR
jgi:hypothetical protein